MKQTVKYAATTCGLALTLLATGCGSLTEREKATAIGAGVGGVAGSVLSGGGAVGTVGGAAVGGVIGNQIGKRKEDDR